MAKKALSSSNNKSILSLFKRLPSREAEQSLVAPNVSVNNIDDETDEKVGPGRGPCPVKPIHEAVQDTARILNLDASGCLNFRQPLLSLVSNGIFKDKLVEFIDADMPRPDKSRVPITTFAENENRKN